jgi:uncharacterized membrane protein HdeD (DUF308 family)
MCTPILFLGISLSENKFKNFVVTILKYSITKFGTQILVVFLLYLFFGKMFTKYVSKLSVFITIFFGIVILFFGIFQIINFFSNKKHNFFNKNLVPTTIGIFSGTNLCLPKIFVLGYIFVKSKNLVDILNYTTVFTIGEILSPIIIVFVLINFFKTKIEKVKKNVGILNFFGAVIFIVLGIINILIGIKNFLINSITHL